MGATLALKKGVRKAEHTCIDWSLQYIRTAYYYYYYFAAIFTFSMFSISSSPRGTLSGYL